MTFALTVLGTSGRFATAARACSSYLLELGDARVWLDAGGGSWRNLLSHVSFSDVDGVIVSHRHPDHTIDLFQLAYAIRYGLAEPLDRIPLWAPHETVDRIAAYDADIGEAFDVRVVAAGDVVDVAGAKVSFVRMAHPPETLGVRVERDGRVLAYSADSGPAADFDALAAGADVFVCEATLQNVDSLWEGHLSAAQAGTIAARVGARRLYLTHFKYGRDESVSLDEARAAAGAGVLVEIARDNERVEVGA